MVLGAAFLFSTGGVAIKSCGLSNWQIAGFRCAIAGLALWIAARWAGAQDHSRSAGQALADRLRRLPVSLVYAATLVLFSLANKATTSANAIFLQSAAPLYILLLSPWLLREKIRGRDLLLMLVLAAGLVILIGGVQQTWHTAPDPGLGNVYGALAGFFWALTLVGLRRLANTGSGRDEALWAVIMGNLLAFVLTLPLALPLGTVSWSDLGWILYLGLFQIAGAYWLLTRGMRGVPAFEASLLLLLEPMLNPLWTWWIHGESPSQGTWIGGMLIISAATAKTWFDVRSSTPATAP